MQDNGKGNLLELVDVKKYFRVRRGFRRSLVLRAVDGVNLQLKGGEALGIVGESGCGKTTLGRTVLMLHKPGSGKVLFEGTDLCSLSEKEMRRMRRQIQIIFQDPFSSLNPRMTVGKMLHQILRCHGMKEREQRDAKCEDVLKKVGLEIAHLDRYPHEFSGGQRQRIAIARSLILDPRLIVADEPTSALDMSIQAQILNLMKSLQKELAISFIFITHNLSAARFLCDKIAVMYLGKIVEVADRTELLTNPKHPYTKALLRLCPKPEPGDGLDRLPLAGEIPSAVNMPSGCRFHPRCAFPRAVCRERIPEIRESTAGHYVACHIER